MTADATQHRPILPLCFVPNVFLRWPINFAGITMASVFQLGKAMPTRAVCTRGTAGGTARFELWAGGEAKGVD